MVVFEKCLSFFLIKWVAPLVLKSSAITQPPGRSKPHFLILRYRYYSQNRSMGDSTEKFMLDGSLVASQTATFEIMCYEDDLSMPWGELRLLERCIRSSPDAIVLSSWWHRRPSLGTLKYLKERWHIPVIAVWWDTCWKEFFEDVQPVLPLIEVNVVPDNPNLLLMDKHSRYFDKFLPLWVPLDPSIYRSGDQPRDIQVCFLGQLGGYRDYRRKHIQAVVESKIPVWLSTADRDRQPSHEEYVRILQRSRIGINFSFSKDGHQLKARVFETMLCGAMLLESENDQISRYFVPMEEYVSFSSEEDLVAKIQYYLAHEDERAAIAARGEQKAREHYSPARFWSRISNELDRAVMSKRS